MKKKHVNTSPENDFSVDVKFCSDNDAIEIIYLNGSKSQKIAEARRNKGSATKTETPTHKRLAALRGSSPATPPSKRAKRSLRLGSKNREDQIDSIPEEDETDEEDEDDPHIPLKPKELFPENDEDEEQEESNEPAIFSSRRHRKGQMVQKAMDKAYKNSPSRNSGIITPTKPEVTTPKSKRLVPTCKAVTPKNSNVTQLDAKTPHSQRLNIKKNLVSMMNEDDSDWDGESESDISSEESEMDIDFAPTPSPVTPRRRGRKPANTPVQTPSRSSSRVQNIESVYKADDYFVSHGSKKVMTSDHTLNKLQNPRLCPETMQELLNKIPTKHEQEIDKLSEKNDLKFKRWMCLLGEGFNLLLHGLGSKKSILDDFHKEMLQNNEDIIVINGFFPSLTLKDILKTIAEVILKMDHIPGDEVECCDLIVESYKHNTSDSLYMLVNNLDGIMLQGDKCQAILARLASVPNIHLVATIDHINAPLLFDLSLLSRYNFLWQDVTTFMTYTEETSYENSLLVQQSGGLALASLHSVFQSLTSNAKEIYMLLVERQLESEDPKYAGMAFRDLYHECRERFLVSTDLALRSQLTEFFDHQLVRNKRGYDGSEMLHIPIPKAALQEFQAMQNNE